MRDGIRHLSPGTAVWPHQPVKALAIPCGAPWPGGDGYAPTTSSPVLGLVKAAVICTLVPMGTGAAGSLGVEALSFDYLEDGLKTWCIHFRKT